MPICHTGPYCPTSQFDARAVPYRNKLLLLSLQCLLAPLNSVSKLICVEECGVLPLAQMPLFNDVETGLPAASLVPVLWSAELICLTTHSTDADTTAPPPPTRHIQGGPIKNVALYFCPYLCQLLTNFQNSFTSTPCRQIAIMWLLYTHQSINASLHYLVKYKWIMHI